MSNYDHFDFYDQDISTSDKVSMIDEIMDDATIREKKRIIGMLENKLNSIPFKLTDTKGDKLIVKKTIREIINLIKDEIDNDTRNVS